MTTRTASPLTMKFNAAPVSRMPTRMMTAGRTDWIPPRSRRMLRGVCCAGLPVKIAYLVNSYPLPSQTFIRREILALERLGARRWLTVIAVTWGLLATGLAFVRNEYEFYALRFALGAAEAGFFPGVVYYFTRWLPSAERGKAMAIFLSGSAIATILSGPLSSYLLQLSVPGLQPWQWMIVFEGAFSVVMAGVLWLLLDSHISDARWLADGERASLEQTLEAERARSARPTSAAASPIWTPAPISA